MTARPSATALKIARFILLLDAVPRLAPVLPPGAAQTAERVLRASGALPVRTIDMMRKPATLRFYERAEKLFGRGQLLWFGVRKSWVFEAVERSIADGARQVLVLGAGFDPLASLIAGLHPEVLCVEIDSPATAVPKREALARIPPVHTNQHVIAADLGQVSLEAALQETPWRKDVRSVVVAEGLLMYLRPSDVTGLFSSVRSNVGPGSRIAVTAMNGDAEGKPQLMFAGGWFNRIVQLALRAVGEPLRWGIAPNALPGWLEQLGFRPLDQPDTAELRRRILDPVGLSAEPLAPYEHVCLAELRS